MIKRDLPIALIVILSLAYLPAADSNEAITAEKEEKGAQALTKKCKNRVIASPIVFYTPETRLAFGGGGSFVFRLAGCDKKSRPSSISPLLIYTLEKQFKAQVGTALYFKNNNYQLNAEIKLEKYPNKFYGVGSSTREQDEELYTSRSIDLFLSLLKKIGGGFNIGIQYHFMDWEITETEEDGQLAGSDFSGSDGGALSGVSFVVNRDTRDNIFFPMKGDFFELNTRFYKKFLGSDFNFTTSTLNLRKYFTLFSSHVFAVQSLVRAQSGNVPFMNLASVGGQYIMRGYFEGRFRDKNLLVFQAEYRVPLFWRFGAVGFAGFGNVAEKFNQLNLGKLKPSYGVGLRFLFDKKEKIWLRFDVGFGKDATGFYASIFEAF